MRWPIAPVRRQFLDHLQDAEGIDGEDPNDVQGLDAAGLGSHRKQLVVEGAPFDRVELQEFEPRPGSLAVLAHRKDSRDDGFEAVSPAQAES